MSGDSHPIIKNYCTVKNIYLYLRSRYNRHYAEHFPHVLLNT